MWISSRGGKATWRSKIAGRVIHAAGKQLPPPSGRKTRCLYFHIRSSLGLPAVKTSTPVSVTLRRTTCQRWRPIITSVGATKGAYVQQGLLKLCAEFAVDSSRRPFVGPVMGVPLGAEVYHLNTTEYQRGRRKQKPHKKLTGSIVKH